MRKLFLSLILLSAPAAAQIMSGSIAGTIVDSSGATIAGAALTLVHTSTGATRKDVSEASGDFLFNGIDGGEYSLRIEKPGFKLMRREGIVLATGDRIALGKIALDLGSVNETV